MSQTTADSAGKFTVQLDAPPGPMLEIIADVPGVGWAEATPTSTKPLQLRVMAAAQAKVVFLGPDEKPVGGLRVSPLMVSFGASAVGGHQLIMIRPLQEVASNWSVTTDGDGACTLRGYPPMSQVTLRCDDERFAEMTFADHVLFGAAGQSPVTTIDLMAASTIVGTVRYDKTNEPAAGVKLYAQAINGSGHYGSSAAVTDGNGHYEMKRLAPGGYVIAMRPHEPPYDWTAAAASVTVESGATAEGDLTLVHGGMLTGKVRDASTGAGLAGMGVGVYGPARPLTAAGIQRAVTDAQGNYALRVPPGIQHVYLSSEIPAGYRAPRSDRSHMVDVEVAEGGTATANIDLARANDSVVQGVVLGPDEKPVAGATVLCEEPDARAMMEPFVRTDSAGKFQIHAGPDAKLRARSGELATTVATSLRGAGAGGVTLHLSAHATFSLSVHVCDNQGAAVDSATVSMDTVVGLFGSRGPRYPADQNGNVRFDDLSMDRTYCVVADAPGFKEAQKNVPAETGAQKEPRIELVVEPE